MSTVAFFIAVLVVASATGLVALLGFAMTKANDDLRSFVDFEGTHFNE